MDKNWTANRFDLTIHVCKFLVEFFHVFSQCSRVLFDLSCLLKLSNSCVQGNYCNCVVYINSPLLRILNTTTMILCGYFLHYAITRPKSVLVVVFRIRNNGEPAIIICSLYLLIITGLLIQLVVIFHIFSIRK